MRKQQIVRKAKRSLVALLAGAAMAISGTAHAGDENTEVWVEPEPPNYLDVGQNLPASACHVTQSWMKNRLSIAADGSIYNAGGGFLNIGITVDCPVPSDPNPGTTDDGSEFVYIDDNASGDIQCTLISSQTGSMNSSSITRSSSGTDDAAQHALSLAGLKNFNESGMILRCSLPPADAEGGLVALVGYAVSIERTAFFDDELTYSASHCRNMGSPETYEYSFSDGAVGNPATSSGGTSMYECPMDTTVYYTGKTEKAVSRFGMVEIVDHSPFPIYCAFKAESLDSQSTYSHNISSVNIDDGDYHYLSYYETSQLGHNHLMCMVPPRDSAGNESYVVSYNVGQFR